MKCSPADSFSNPFVRLQQIFLEERCYEGFTYEQAVYGVEKNGYLMQRDLPLVSLRVHLKKDSPFLRNLHFPADPFQEAADNNAAHSPRGRGEKDC